MHLNMMNAASRENGLATEVAVVRYSSLASQVNEMEYEKYEFVFGNATVASLGRRRAYVTGRSASVLLSPREVHRLDLHSDRSIFGLQLSAWQIWFSSLLT